MSDAADRIRALRAEGDYEGAQRLAVDLAATHPRDALLQYEAACVHDFLGLEAEAVPYYVAAIDAGLGGEALRGAYLGLSSTYRALGRYAEALATFDAGLRAFPDAAELQTFQAMALYNVGRAKEAAALLLTVLARTSADAQLQRYRRAIEFYAQDLDARW